MNSINRWFKIYVLASAVFSAAIMFALYLLGKSDNKLCRSMWAMLSAEYTMAFYVIARPFMSQQAFDHSMKAEQDRFCNAIIAIWKACGIVK